MDVQDIYDFIDSLDEDEFFEYLTPTSYYNTNLYHSICGKNLPKIGNRKLLEIYFLLSENQDDILSYVFEKMYEYQDEEEEDDDFEIEMNGLNWYVLIFYLAECDYYEIYRRLKTTDELNKEIVQLIELNENFDRENNYIFNDVDETDSYWTKNLLDCVYLAWNRDKVVDYKKVILEESFSQRSITFKKGDLILFKDFKELKPVEDNFFNRIKNEFIQVKRDLSLSKLLGEKIIIRFSDFQFRKL
jgi:hypothetical protein